MRFQNWIGVAQTSAGNFNDINVSITEYGEKCYFSVDLYTLSLAKVKSNGGSITICVDLYTLSLAKVKSNIVVTHAKVIACLV